MTSSALLQGDTSVRGLSVFIWHGLYATLLFLEIDLMCVRAVFVVSCEQLTAHTSQ